MKKCFMKCFMNDNTLEFWQLGSNLINQLSIIGVFLNHVIEHALTPSPQNGNIQVEAGEEVGF